MQWSHSLIKTEGSHILGTFTTFKWKQSKDFYGNTNGFIFQLYPTPLVFRPMVVKSNVIKLNDELGFGGTKDMPWTFIPASIEVCNASIMDKTFREGNILPVEALEKFTIDSLELWGVEDDAVIEKGLIPREEYWENTESNI